MDQNRESHLSDASTPESIAARSPVVRFVTAVIALLVVAVGAYSIYIAAHEPDPQETVVLGQTRLASGCPAALRVLVRNRTSGNPIEGAQVALSLRGAASTVQLGTFRTDITGSLAEPLSVPDIAPGPYELCLNTRSSIGRDSVIEKVEIQHPARVLLSSDKPVYQPGQTIHLRSLTSNSRTQKPFVGEAITFEICDPKGNKVFKDTQKSSAFGIASADFVLATELNLGRYEIRAIAGGNTAERAVEVKRYVLPKFKVQIATDRAYYLPGQTVSGSVQANYFFGQPVSGGTVKLTAMTLQEQPVAISELQGQTDSAGKFAFQFQLPEALVGMPQKNEQAFLDLKVELRDTAQHVEETTRSLTVAGSELELTAIPEAGALVPGVDNLLYVLTAYPDGRPAACKVFVSGSAYESDAQGVCTIKIGAANANRQFEIVAIDPTGRKTTLQYRPDANHPSPPLLLRTDKAVYQAGENAQVTLLSPEEGNTVFIDFIKDAQTVLTKSVALKKHEAAYTLPLPATLVGTLQVNAYCITAAGEDRGCSRIIYVNPASGLRIAARMSKDVYRPGEVAQLNLAVTDAEGRPAPAALGIAAVDESVFALSENRPGLLQQFLEVEGDLLKPRYQIKSFECPELFLNAARENQALAQAYFASRERPAASPGIAELVSSGAIPRQLVEHAREMRGTPTYEKYRKDPQFADALRLLDNEHGLYNLRQVTGPIKFAAAEARRKAYFSKLKEFLGIGTLALMFLSPLLVYLYYRRPDAGVAPEGPAQTQPYLRICTSTYNLLGLLTILPAVCYPAGALLLAQVLGARTGWGLLGMEAIVVVCTLSLQLHRVRLAQAQPPALSLRPIRFFLRVFLIQFLVSRACVAWSITHPAYHFEGLGLIWFLASVTAPIIVLMGLGLRVRRQFITLGIPVRAAGSRLIEVLVVMSVMAILTAMLLPALARSKARAQSINFLNDLKQINLAREMADEEHNPGTAGQSSSRVRHDFPETLLWKPELITDDHGRASLEIPLADSITTWRASVEGINGAGKMGSAQLLIPVFQDFFVDLDLPVSMSLGDQVSVPITCYNYLKEPQNIRLTITSANWFESPARNLNVHLEPNSVKSVSLPLKVLRVGNRALQVTAQGTKLSDAIEREVRVLPTGERQEHTRNGILKDRWSDSFTIAPEAIADSQSLWVKFYPSRFSEVVEGLDSLFAAPYGCFEQTSSTTYPNVLVLDYMKRMGRLTPEIEIKACKLISTGYQRLLTFEVAGGGFEWFGHPPANICLTAYGILEFTDMARVHPVDQTVTERARTWLFSQQNSDGSWDEIHRGWTWAGRGSMTAFVAWALAESGDQSPNLDRALSYLQGHPRELTSTYSKALAANAFLARDCRDALGQDLARQLKESAVQARGKGLHWTSDGYSATYSRGEVLDVETTALCATAMMKTGLWPSSVKEALTWISQVKTSCGTWGSTQPTIQAMRALLAGSSASVGQEFDSEVTLLLNGKTVDTFHVNKKNSDVMQQVELTRFVRPGENQIEFRQAPTGELPFQLAGVCWLPASSSSPASAKPEPIAEPLQIDVHFDRTTLPVNDLLKCNVTVRNNTGQVINMAIVDLSIPPGFDVDSTAFDELRENGHIAKYELTANQVILYLREISNLNPFQFTYSLRAKYPLHVQTPLSQVYEYYQPKNRAQSTPVMLQALGN